MTVISGLKLTLINFAVDGRHWPMAIAAQNRRRHETKVRDELS